MKKINKPNAKRLQRNRASGNAKRRLVFAVAVAAIISCAALAYGVAAHNRRASNRVAPHVTALVSRSPMSVPLQSGQQPSDLAVNRAELDRHVVRALNSLGDQFEKAGMERSILLGTLTRHMGNDKETSQFRIIREFPDKLRFEEQTAHGVRVRGFNGKRPWVDTGSLSDEDSGLIQTLVRDTVEHFIAGQAANDATRVLGDRYRMDDGSTRDYKGPYYDILNVVDRFEFGDQINKRPTLYYLDSETGLPSRIVYEQQQGSAITRIEVEFSNWGTVAGQQVAGKVVRKENGITVLELDIRQAAFGPALPDGVFNAPGGR